MFARLDVSSEVGGTFGVRRKNNQHRTHKMFCDPSTMLFVSFSKHRLCPGRSLGVSMSFPTTL